MNDEDEIHPGGEVIGMLVATTAAMIAYVCNGDPDRAAKITRHVKKELDGSVADKIKEIITNIQSGQRYSK